MTGYAWNFGDGTTASGRTASHRYPNVSATYQVTLTVTDSRNQKGSTTRQVRCYRNITTPICFGQI